MTQHDLENFDTEQKRMDEARRHFERALELRRNWRSKNPGALPDMARTLNNLGNLDRLQNRIDEARQHYEERLKFTVNWRSRIRTRTYRTWRRR